MHYLIIYIFFQGGKELRSPHQLYAVRAVNYKTEAADNLYIIISRKTLCDE